MSHQVIRSLEDSKTGKLELVLEDSDIFWTKDGKKIREQNEQFKKYNPILVQNLEVLKNYRGKGITQSELVTLLELDRTQINHYFNNLRPDLHSEKRQPILIKSIYEMLADFMPVIEKWQKSKQVAAKNKISQSTVRNYCIANFIENKFFLHTYWVSPMGLTKLKELMHIEYSLAREWSTTAKVAQRLGVSQSVITLHCRKKQVSFKRYNHGFRIPNDEIFRLGTDIKKSIPFEFAGETYYPLSAVAKQTAEIRGTPDLKEYYLKRFYHLRESYPQNFPSLIKSKTRGVTETAKNLLIELMTQAEASRELEVSAYEIRKCMRLGILDRLIIGPTNWTTYSSVMKQKKQNIIEKKD